jgi:hypothetical protein
LKNLLISIFTLEDAKKVAKKFRLSKDFNWADCVESILKEKKS